jgi:glycosyltransferase involved in cell wall biosynthesis
MRLVRRLKIILYDPSPKGGICHYTHQLAENLTELGHDVTLVATEGYELCDRTRAFKTHFLFRTSWLASVFAIGQNNQQRPAQTQLASASPATGYVDRPPGKVRLLFSLLKTARLRLAFLKGALFFLVHRPDVIHFQWLVDRKQDYCLLNWVKRLGFKIVYTAHNVLPHQQSTLDDKRALLKIYRTADKLIVHSESNKSEMVETFGINGSKISVVPHGSNNIFYFNGELSQDSARRKLDIPNRKKVLLFFGMIQRYKGLEYLLEAFNTVKKDLPDLMLLIAGPIYQGDYKEYRYYRRLIDHVRDQENVVCRAEYIPLDKVNYYFAAADLVVLPYVKSYTSGVLLTAYAAGRPVIVTDTGGLKEVVENGKTGYVVPPKNVAALTEAIIEILKSSNQLKTMGRYAKYLADTRYSWQSVAAETVRVYQGVLGYANSA